MQKPSLLIATPCYCGNVTSQYVVSLLGAQSLLVYHGLGCSVYFHSDSLITRARNNIAGKFLRQQNHTHLLFIDADLSFDPKIILRYLDFDKDVIGGIYPMKQSNIGALRRSPIEDDRTAEAVSYTYSSRIRIEEDNMPRSGFVRVEYAATGFMMIKRQALETMAAQYPELRYQYDFTGAGAEVSYAFFDTMIHEGRFLPEDYSFCKRWKDIGGEIWGDVTSKFTHIGSYVYSGDIAACIREGSIVC